MGPLPSGHHLLVVVDYYSRYYEVVLQTTTSGKVIDCLDKVFSRHGLPMSLKSDNGPQFASEEFREYCKENNIVHCKVTARWTQVNGEVERQNASLLKRIQIAQAELRDWRKETRKYLTSYRSIEHPTTGKSPAELLFARKMRGKLPEMSQFATSVATVVPIYGCCPHSCTRFRPVKLTAFPGHPVDVS